MKNLVKLVLGIICISIATSVAYLHILHQIKSIQHEYILIQHQRNVDANRTIKFNSIGEPLENNELNQLEE